MDKRYRTEVIMPEWIRRKIAKVDELINECFNNYKPYISCSWGKDSSLVLFLAHRLFPEIPVIYMNSGYAMSDTYKFRDWYLENIGIKEYYEIPCPEDYIELNLKYGLPSIDRTESDHKKVIEIIKKDVLDEFAKSKGFNCCIWGIRAEETAGRRALLRKRGLIYDAGGMVKCSPIGWWKGAEVWTAIEALNIPYNPIYDKIMPPYFTRESIKNSGWLTTDKANRGRVMWMKKFYPEEYNKLQKLFPEVRHYV